MVYISKGGILHDPQLGMIWTQQLDYLMKHNLGWEMGRQPDYEMKQNSAATGRWRPIRGSQAG